MNNESKISSIVNKMKTLKSYKPTPWLINGIFHTYWGMVYKGHFNFKPFRENIDFRDGGQATIEHFVLETTKEAAPIFSWFIQQEGVQENLVRILPQIIL